MLTSQWNNKQTSNNGTYINHHLIMQIKTEIWQN